MSYTAGSIRTVVLLSVLAIPLLSVSGHTAMDPRFELDPQTLDSTITRKTAKPAKYHPRNRTARGSGAAARGNVYTVRQGDHLFKILMRDYGLTNDEAESFIEEIRRENNIYDIRRLRIGQKIIIPPVKRASDGTLKTIMPLVGGGTARQAFTLESPEVRLSEQEASSRFRTDWDKLIPAKIEQQQPISFQTSAFSLNLDPQRYPVYAAQDGARILLDADSTIPPLVRTLIMEKDPKIRIVSESPKNGKRFLDAMLAAGGFYSVEENFSLEFGTDPKLTVHADYKIEKTAESLLKQDVALFNDSHYPVPAALTDFLKKEGFSLYEPYAAPRSLVVRTPQQLHQITASSQTDMVDTMLKALDVSTERDRRLDVFAADNNGISLSVKAERTFSRNGQRFVVTRFDGDPVTYTLFRILETKGYRVVILENQDTFRKVAEKLFSRMQIKGNFGQHSLLAGVGATYDIKMSGYRLEDTALPGGSLFLTNLELDRIIRTLLTENGYSIHGK